MCNLVSDKDVTNTTTDNLTILMVDDVQSQTIVIENLKFNRNAS